MNSTASANFQEENGMGWLSLGILQQHFISHASRIRLFANSIRHTLGAREIKRYSFGI
jgi:hypothetical protein